MLDCIQSLVSNNRKKLDDLLNKIEFHTVSILPLTTSVVNVQIGLSSRLLIYCAFKTYPHFQIP